MNSNINTEIKSLFGIQSAIETYQKPVLTQDLDLKNIQNINISSKSLGTILTTKSKGRTFINYAELSYVKAVGDTGVYLAIQYTKDNKVNYICQLLSTTLTVEKDHINTANIKIEVDPGTNITLFNTGTYADKAVNITLTYQPE